MASLNFPTGLIPDLQTFGIKYNTQISVSPISGTTQVIEMPGARWTGNISFRDLTPTDAAKLKGFLLELRGSAGLFRFGDLSQTVPQDTTFSAASLEVETGSTNRLVYTTPDAGIFTIGDYIQIGAITDAPELKMVIAVSGIAGSQQALTIEPAIRRTDYLGLPITFSSPRGEFRIINEAQLQWSVRSKALLSDFNLDFLEFFA